MYINLSIINCMLLTKCINCIGRLYSLIADLYSPIFLLTHQCYFPSLHSTFQPIYQNVRGVLPIIGPTIDLTLTVTFWRRCPIIRFNKSFSMLCSSAWAITNFRASSWGYNNVTNNVFKKNIIDQTKDDK